jgi:hypothetical protein
MKDANIKFLNAKIKFTGVEKERLKHENVIFLLTWKAPH